MIALLTILIIIASILLVLIILVQSSKGGLASNFSSSQQIMGARKTADFLEKATWTLASTLIVLCLLTAAMTSGTKNQTQEIPKSEIEEQIENFQPIETVPEMPKNVPLPNENSDKGKKQSK